LLLDVQQPFDGDFNVTNYLNIDIKIVPNLK